MRKTATEIVKKLQDNGYEAYFAGGAVRDLLLRKEPKDIDIATSAPPEQIEKIFSKTTPVGRRFGIITVILNDEAFEVATFRSESDYKDNRRPSKITFSSAKEDAIRRDFTINGLFLNPTNNQIIDYVGGQEDIKKKTIRFIGSAKERIEEDHLRLVRAIRLKTTLGFQYAPETFEAVRNCASLIKEVSAERIRDELNLILKSPNRHQGFIELSESNLLKFIIPKLDEMKGVPQPDVFHKEGDVFVHTYLALKSLPDDSPSYLAWAVMLHDIAKPKTLIKEKRIIFHDHAQESAKLAREILGRLKFPKFETYDICWLIENHMRIADIEKMRPNKALEFVLDPKFSDLIKLAEADAKGTYPIRDEFVANLKKYVERATKFKENKQHLKEIRILTGDDLIKIGIEPGERFKKILDEIDSMKVEGKLKTKEEAIAYITKKLKDEN
ncbi:MAG: CCA tRNA nucleotidyltransferase [Candidatus Berkelbacteria bacterium]|nr:CCA tRNA nucleotidyltransferase [Candidatus Berkelbacteria bacterium]